MADDEHCYLPTPDEIAAATEAIRNAWRAGDGKLKRRQCGVRPVETAMINMRLNRRPSTVGSGSGD